jgi:excisionase family DNA binding protein
MSQLPKDAQFLTTDEVADYLRVSRRTVWRWCEDGTLPAFRFGRVWRIQRTQLESLIDAMSSGEPAHGDE